MPNDLAEPPFPMAESDEVKMSVSRKLAFQIWDQARRPQDPEASSLPEDTQARIEYFAREVRNATIEQLAGAVKRFMDKNSGTAYETLLSLKE